MIRDPRTIRKRCPVYGCSHHLADRQVVCHEHWESVPEDLKTQMHAAKNDRESSTWKTAVQNVINHLQAEEALRLETRY